VKGYATATGGTREIGVRVMRDDYAGNQYDNTRGVFDVGNRGAYSRGADKRRK